MPTIKIGKNRHNPWNCEGFWNFWEFFPPLISYFSLAYHKISTKLAKMLLFELAQYNMEIIILQFNWNFYTFQLIIKLFGQSFHGHKFASLSDVLLCLTRRSTCLNRWSIRHSVLRERRIYSLEADRMLGRSFFECCRITGIFKSLFIFQRQKRLP